jgi:hypothetical protein
MVGNKQVIVGGNIVVGKYINCKILGSENFTTTNVTTGIIFEQKNKIDMINSRVDEINGELPNYDKKISGYVVKKSEGKLSESEIKELDELKSKKAKLNEELETLKQQIQEFEERVEFLENSSVNVAEKVYPGVNITLNKKVYNVKNALGKSSFVLKDGAVFPDKYKKQEFEIEIEEIDETQQKQNQTKIVDYTKIRRSIILEGKNKNQLEKKACDWLGIEPENSVTIVQNKEDDYYTLSVFEVKEKENKNFVRKKLLQIVDIQKVQVIGETIEICLKKASYSMGVPIEDLTYNIIQEGKKGVLGLGKKEYILEVSKKKVKTKAETEKSVDGKFVVKNEIEGLKVKVIPPEGKGKNVEPEEILSYLQSKEYVNGINRKKINQITEKPDSEFHIIADRQPEPKLDAKFELEIPEDKMEAYIKIIPPKKGGIYPDKTKIEKAVKEKEIKDYDLNELYESFNKNNNKEYKIKIAEGKPAIQPVQPVFSIKFDDHDKTGIKSKNKIDFKENSVVVNVTENQLLAVVKEGTPGKPGYDVFGNEIQPQELEDVKPNIGKNVRVSDNETKYYAEIDGWVIYDNNTLKVDDIYHIDGDVDYSTGNITSLGAVVIKGAVKDGFKVQASGDIIVETVEGAHLSSESNIYIKSGVQGKGSALIQAKGEVHSKFIEQATVEAGKDVVVDEAILHSEIYSKNNIIVMKGKKGLMVGGLYSAAKMVAAKNIGNKIATKTVIEAGIDPFIRKEIKQINRDMGKMRYEYDQTRLNLKRLVDEIKAGDVTEAKKTRVKEMTVKYNKIAKDVRYMQTKVKALQKQLMKKTSGYVLAKEKVYTNVEINISRYVYKVDKEIDYCTFHVVNNDIVWKEYDDIIYEKCIKNNKKNNVKDEKN